jgi:hypothetical protein
LCPTAVERRGDPKGLAVERRGKPKGSAVERRGDPEGLAAFPTPSTSSSPIARTCKPVKRRRWFKAIENETQSNAEAGTIAQRSCLCGGGFKRCHAMVGSSGNDDFIVVDSGDRFGCFWPLFPLLVPHKLRGAGRQARLVGVPSKRRRQLTRGANSCVRWQETAKNQRDAQPLQSFCLLHNGHVMSSLRLALQLSLRGSHAANAAVVVGPKPWTVTCVDEINKGS